MDAMQYNRDNLADKLRAHGINPTHQRIEIAHALFSRCEHLSADRIMAIVNERHCETSKATVYNTLNLFLEKKLIREVLVDPNKVFYDPNTSAHYHMYDVESGRLTDIDAADIRISGLPALPAGMVTEGMDIIIRVRSADFPLSPALSREGRGSRCSPL
jgi:Fur family iron response transcriptional regulator